jgi:hypothetical protein
MTDELKQDETSSDNRPDYVAVCYPMIRLSNGWRRRKAVIGAAWKNDKGAICFRPSGKQVIEDDIYLFPANDDSSAALADMQVAA